MKKSLLVLVAVLMSVLAMAQAPQKMTYQAVVRDSNGQLVSNGNVGVRITIVRGSETGTEVYSQTETVRTNDNGLFTTMIGGTGFDAIDWGNGPYYLKSEVDPDGGSNYILTTTQQMVSVPYALHAGTVDSIIGGVNITETDPIFSAWNKDYNDLINRPTIPTNVSELTNDAGYLIEYTEIQTLSNVASLGNAVDTQIKQLSDPTEPMDAVNLKTLNLTINSVLDDWTHLLDSFAHRYDSIIAEQAVIIDSLQDVISNMISTKHGDTTAVACESFIWYDNTYSASGSYTHTFTAVSGVDSIVTLHLTINHNSTGDTIATAEGVFVWYGITYLESTETPTHVFINVSGCDSIVTLHLSITPITSGFDVNGASYSTFSVASDQTVRFSKGNLQFTTVGTHAVNGGGTTTGTWRFAEHQCDIIGTSNSNTSSTYTGWIDLFGWGTSGWNSGANEYKPWSIRINNGDYNPGGSDTNGLTDEYANADWGIYNAISNGGNQARMWRTLTNDEWIYLLFTRSASTVNGISDARYVKATVNSIKGIIVFPDIFTMPGDLAMPTNINTSNGDYTSNTYTLAQWSKMELSGAVFLPVTGLRSGSSVINSHIGTYWSSSYCDKAYTTYFGNESVSTSCSERYLGRSVRLVKNVQ